MADTTPKSFSPKILNQTKIVSVKVFRARLIDSLIGRSISINQDSNTNVAFDIDDLESSDDDAILDATNGLDILDNIKRVSKRDPLNWQNVTDPQYKSRLTTFRRGLKKLFTDEINTNLLGDISKLNTLTNSLQEIDITEMVTIQSIQRDMNFGNSCVLNLSLTRFRELKSEKKLIEEAIPRENDVIEIIAQYPDGRKDRLFLGLVSVVDQEERHGTLTSIVLTVFGISKLLSINHVVTDRAIVSQYEDGSLVQTGLSVFQGGSFAEKTVDQIFLSLMGSQLALIPEITTGTSQRTILLVEITLIGNRIATIDARISELSNTLSGQALNEVGNEFNIKEPLAIAAITRKTDIGSRKRSIQSLEDEISASFVETNFAQNPVFATERQDMITLLVLRLLRSQFNRRVVILRAILPTLEVGETVDEKRSLIKFSFEFENDAFTNLETFQTLYIPLITMMAVRNRKLIEDKKGFSNEDFENRVVAKFSGRRSRAFDLMIKNGFRLFFSQLDTPERILREIRSKAKFVVYENESNQIVCEIPRYNEFGKDDPKEGERNFNLVEDINDFIIFNPLAFRVRRQDINLRTRADIRGYAPFLGDLGERTGTLTMGQYTDTAVMAKYGMRVDPPTYNPNVNTIEKIISPFMMAAIELTNKNAETRSIEVEVAADRGYKLGRMYFINRKSLEKFAGGFLSKGKSEPLEIQGYVGYLYGYNTNVSVGRVITHRLIFRYVRKARLISIRNSDGSFETFGANFRILPDINGLMDILDSEVARGVRSLDVFGRVPLPTPPATAEIQTSTVTGERFYQTDFLIAPSYKGNDRDFFTLNFLSSENPGKIDVLSRGSRFISTSIRASHHKDLPPNNAASKKVAVIKVDNTTEGMQASLIQELHALDLRLRPLNRYLFTTEARPFEDPILSPNKANDLKIKKDIFKAIYIPNFTVNRFYRISGLTGFDMNIINLNRTQDNVVGIVNKNHPKIGTLQKGLLFEDFVIESGDPIRLKDAKPHFVILRAIFRGNQNTINLAVLGNDIKKEINTLRGIVENVTGGAITSAEVEAIITQFSPPTNDQFPVFIPAIFEGPINTNDIMKNLDPGFPLTIFDAAYDGFPPPDSLKFEVSTFRFPGVVTLEDPDSKGEAGGGELAHAGGLAIDVSLVPYFATTGIVLAPHNPYILSGSYNPIQNSGLLHGPIYNGQGSILTPIPTEFTTPGPVSQTIRREFNPTETKLTTKDSVKQSQIAKLTFENLFKLKGLVVESTEPSVPTKIFMEFDDLHINDQFFYHLQKIN